jgi:hypothetical protein
MTPQVQIGTRTVGAEIIRMNVARWQAQTDARRRRLREREVLEQPLNNGLARQLETVNVGQTNER